MLIRSQVAHIARNYFYDKGSRFDLLLFIENEGFIEVETPTLFKTTVESGAKEFIVPTRQVNAIL
jgi:aspartyl-tRNA synthetase